MKRPASLHSLWWLLANLLAWTAGFVFGCIFGGPVLGGAMLGSALALGQGLVLRQIVSGPGPWLFASVVSGAIGSALGSAAGVPLGQTIHPSVGPVVFGSVTGGSIGFVQWLSLRNQVARAGWWILATTISAAIGMIAGFAVTCAVALLAGAVSGLIAGGISGIVLIWLVRPPPRGRARNTQGRRGP